MTNKRGFNQQDRERFCNLLKEAGIIEGKVFQTIYGPLEIRMYDPCKRILALYTRFNDPALLPGKKFQGAYGVHSANGEIYSTPFNGFSGKWNHHFCFEYGWNPESAAKKILDAIEYIKA